MTRTVKGYPRREWVKTRGRNEALDARIYARAAAAHLGIDNWGERRWAELEGAVGAVRPAEPPDVPATPHAPAEAAEVAAVREPDRVPVRRRGGGGGWLGRGGSGRGGGWLR